MTRPRQRGPLVVLLCALLLCVTARLGAHDAEKTEATLKFAADGSFVLEVANDPDWLLLRLEPFAAESGVAGASTTPRAVASTAERDARLASFASVFIDRIVLWIDGREVRPTAAEYIAPRLPRAADSVTPLGIYRLRGRVDSNVRSLRWYYGIVIDPYPLRVQRADGRARTETILGRAWSETIDLSGQFERPSPWRVTREFLSRGFVRVIPWAGLRPAPASTDVKSALAQTLFILALLSLSLAPRTFARQWIAFTLAHALGVVVAVRGIAAFPSRIGEPFLFVAIALVLLEGMLARRLSLWRLAMIAVVGIVCGLQSGGSFTALNAPPSATVVATAAFVLGTLIGHAAIAATGLALGSAFTRIRLRLRNHPSIPVLERP